MKKVALVLGIALGCMTSKAQQEGFNWNDSAVNAANPEERNWKDIHLISVPTTKTVDQHHVEFAIMHRFGSMGANSGGGVHTLYGFDIASDIYFNFEFGVLSNLQIGIGRSKQKELIDVDVKYRPLTQTPGGSPVSLAIYGDAGFIPETAANFYEAGDSNQNPGDRFVYLTQVILSRRFNRHISIELVPSLSFRNHVLYAPSISNNTNVWDENAIPAIGVGARYMFNGMMGIVADYYYIISAYRQNNSVQPYYNPFSIGLEMHTGGHVFQITFSNASALIPTNIIPYTNNAWKDGGYKLGFSISRMF